MLTGGLVTVRTGGYTASYCATWRPRTSLSSRRCVLASALHGPLDRHPHGSDRQPRGRSRPTQSAGRRALADRRVDFLDLDQGFVEWLRTLKAKRWASLDVERARALVARVDRNMPDQIGLPKLHVLAFSASLTPRLRNIHPTVRWNRDTVMAPAWTANRPIHVLWATLWDWATRGGRLRRCPRCQAFFPAERAGKTHCSRECVNRASAARWYRSTGKQLRKQRAREGAE